MFLAPVIGWIAANAGTIATLASAAGTVANIATSASSKKSGGGGGTIIQQAAPAAAAEEDAETKRKRVLAMQKQMGRGNTLLTSTSDYAPASTVGGSLRSTLGGS
jgi:hypothetical protein